MTPPPPGPIAIDGPAASGKTTVGEALARELGFGFLDTGLMYRAVTLAALREGVDAADPAACGSLVDRLAMTVAVDGVATRILLGDEDVTALLREDEVERNVSRYSAIPAIREAMVARQRAIAAPGTVILAGRDIGTVVLPDAPVKLFLTASEDARSWRRSRQAELWGQDGAEARSRDHIEGRDRLDSTRAASPLRAADDAITIDTTALSLDETIAEARKAVLAAAAAPVPAAEVTARPARDRHSRPPAPRSEAPPPRPYLKPLIPFFYWLTHYLMKGAVFLVARWTVSGRENVPAKGPLIIASNHFNNIDPPLMSSSIGRVRRIRYMAKVELFRGPFGFFTPMWGAFPVRRLEGDFGAVLAAERILRDGGAIGMFPEGTRSRTGQVTPFLPGTAALALRTGATILPCSVAGTGEFRNLKFFVTRPKITVRIGEPIAVERVRRPTPEQVSQLTERLEGAVRALLPARYGGTYTE